jgi:exonuclease I
MMDSKQLALVYLMEEANRMASICTKTVHNLNKKKTNNDIAEQMAKIFVAMKEVVVELKIDEQQVEGYLVEEQERRQKEL